VLKRVAACCSVVQCVAACCKVLRLSLGVGIVSFMGDVLQSGEGC